jgi:hypothetical protein
MSICVAKLITCARQLLFVSNGDHQVLRQVEPTHLSFLFFESYSLVLTCSDLQSHSKFRHYGSVVACIVASDMANLNVVYDGG